MISEKKEWKRRIFKLNKVPWVYILPLWKSPPQFFNRGSNNDVKQLYCKLKLSRWTFHEFVNASHSVQCVVHDSFDLREKLQ